MRIINVFNNHLPFEGYTALTILPFVFVRNNMKKMFTKTAERHEKTHALQQMEMLVVGLLMTWMMYEMDFGWFSLSGMFAFFEVYILEWIMKLPFCKFNRSRTYRSVSFEQEAYEHQDEIGYNNVRNHYAWMKYLFTIKPKDL